MNVALVPAGGTGSRFGSTKAKQFLELAGIPIIIRTLRHLATCPELDRIIVAVPAVDLAACQELLTEWKFEKPWLVVTGGKERQDSVREALMAAPAETEYVVVHDAVRPFISAQLVTESLTAARAFRAVVVGHQVTDTVKQVQDGLVVATPPRETLFAVQTPQVFEAQLLRTAHERALAEGWRVTDDAMLVEKLGLPVRIVPGPIHNLKITHPRDLALAEFWLSQPQ
ncbi:MAG: 2-C-methyl-D-erythritol 4-phosphate cytidylyltransferase [Blastocatellia bacterium]|nr:2-C-methyl-D-erythritol 4-phosphate cytidylyltransferase [Blastocatellia bacterium]